MPRKGQKPHAVSRRRSQGAGQKGVVLGFLLFRAQYRPVVQLVRRSRSSSHWFPISFAEGNGERIFEATIEGVVGPSNNNQRLLR